MTVYKSFHIRRLLVVFFIFIPLFVSAQYYSGNVGEYITLPEPIPNGDYRLYSSTFKSYSEYLYVAPGTSSVKILSYFTGHETIRCDYKCYRYYEIAGKQYEDWQDMVTYYFISCNSPLYVTYISVSPSSISLYKGETTYISANVTPSNATNPNVEWTSNNTSIATVDNNGKVSAVGVGNTKIRCSAVDGSGKYGECHVTVKEPIAVTNISLSKSSISIAINESYRLIETVSPSNATNKSVAWKSQNTNIATVDYNGNVTGKSAGKTKIVCSSTDGTNIQAECDVEVYKVNATGVSLNKSSAKVNINETLQLTATVSPSNASDKSITWKSDNTSIATVSSSGLVKGIAEGKTTIRATTSNGKSATCEVTVKKVEATSISLPSSKNVYIGETVTLTYTMTPSNAMSSVTWKSADTSIANVSSSGVVTGKKEGSTNITVTTDNGKSASCKVYVEPKPIDPTKISFSSSSCNVEVGYSTKIRYTLEPENATTTITWKSSDTSIATVSSDGIVKGIKQGTAKITATTANGLSASKWIDVGGFTDGTYFYGTSSDDLDVTYRVTDINAKTCEVFSCNEDAKNIVIPSSVMGYKVTSIRDLAFNHCKVETVVLPNSIIDIGSQAFNRCNSLMSITIPNSVTDIGSRAFFYCENLESATLPNSITRIEECLFMGCKSLTNISGYNNVEYIGSNAFYDTPWLANLSDGANYIGRVLYMYKGKMPANTTFRVKDGCTQIASSAFSSQTGLASITIPSSLVTLESNPFYRCDSLRSITVSAGNPVFDSRNNCNAIIKTKENELVVGCVTTSIPNTVKSICRYAFYYSNAALYEVNIPDNVDSIANWAYYYVPNVKKISIGKGLRTMGNRSFWYGSNANSITVSSANPYFDSRDNCNAIIETATNKLILGCNKTEIPNNVKTIGEFAFANNSIISSITLPNSVTTIEEQAFSYMTNLCSITIGKNVKSLGKNMLYNYTNINNKLISIRSMINFPTDIDKEVFYKCYKEEDSLYNHVTLYIPKDSKANYQSAAGWQNFKHIVEIDEYEAYNGMFFTEKTVEGVELTYMVTDATKKECELVASPVDVKGKVTIPSSANGFTVRSIGEKVFYSYKNDRALTEVIIPNTIKTFGPYAFYFCEDMIATIPSSVILIDDHAFTCCKKITADDLSNVTTFGSFALVSCEKIENIKLGSSVKTIGAWAFEHTGITKITIPKSIENVGHAAFGLCKKLQSIKVEEGNPYYDSRYNCNGIFVKANNTLLAGCMNTVIPEETDTIGYGAFYHHSGLKEIKLPDNLKAIADYAFTGTGLSTITIPESVDSIGKQAFRNCANLATFKVMSKEPIKINEDVFFYETDTIYTFLNVTLYVPFGTKSLYASADVWKNFKNIVEMEQEKIERITVSQFLSKADTKAKYELTGVVKNISNTTTGNFNLEQNGSKVYINGTLDKDGNAQKWGSLGVSEGDSIVLQGVYTTYNSAPAIKNAQYISHRRNMTVNLSKAGYATFYDSKNSFDLPKGLTAKVVTGVSDGKLEYRSLSDNVVPAGVAVMISDNANGGTYTLSQSLSEGRYSGSNLLYGSDETTTTKGDGYHYKLAYGHSGTSLSNVFGWYWGNDYGGAFKSEAHRAWMVVPKSSKTKSFSIEGETTEIVTIDSDDTEGACYDLQGRRVTKPVKNGVYIMNGKTIIVK